MLNDNNSHSLDRRPLLDATIQISDHKSTLVPERNFLACLSDYHFSPQRLPSKKNCLKKYLLMFLASGGGLGYWGIVNKYNDKHQFSEFISISNNIGVGVSVGFFLLQSVDMAKVLLDDLAGTVPPQLQSIIKASSEEKRQNIQRKTAAASSVSGVPFLIIALAFTLPPIEDIESNTWRTVGIALWASYFFIDSVGLHLLPFAVLQSPAYWYYRLPFSVFGLCQPCPADTILDQEITSLKQELQGYQDQVLKLIADRVTSSLEQWIQTISAQISWRCRYDMTDLTCFFSEKQGLERLLFLLQKYPPLTPKAPNFSPGMRTALRTFGAHIQLGSGFAWWTNVYPSLFGIFKQTGIQLTFVYLFTALLGSAPSYSLAVLLAFFGEVQFPDLIDYLTNAVKKLLGYPAEPLLSPGTRLNPPLFTVMVLLNSYITWFSSVNAKALNEEQYENFFSKTQMIVLNSYSDVGVRISTFIALLSLYLNYQVEISAVFSKPDSHEKMFAHLILAKESLPKDILKCMPELSITHLKELDEQKLSLLVGPDKNKTWLNNHEQSIHTCANRLAAKEALKNQKNSSNNKSATSYNIQQIPLSDSGFLSKCCSALFSISQCFSRCRTKPTQDQELKNSL